MNPPREVCSHCRRPRAVCYCAHLVAQETRTLVVFLQHPREARVPIGTARMAHLMLPNSELHRGVHFDDHPRVQKLVADPTAALLFPGAGALDPAALPSGAVETLVVIDGTWAQARKVLRENPLLGRLPRLGLAQGAPGNYRIRREPAAGCLATIEAVSRVLGLLEGDPARFDRMLAAFAFMVNRQLEWAALPGSPRRPAKRAAAAAGQAAAQFVRARLARAVVVHAEVNAHPRGSPVLGRPELLHLVGRRLATGERFQAIVAPRRPLAPRVPSRLGLSEAQILGGEPIGVALARFRAFLRPKDTLCSWGRFTPDQLAVEWPEWPEWPEWLDLRHLLSRRLHRRPGPWDQVALGLGAPAAGTQPGPDDCGRAGRTVAALFFICQALSA